MIAAGVTRSNIAAASGPGPGAKCTRKAGQFQSGKPVKPPITLTPDLPTQTINFGGNRGSEFADVVLRASSPLPASVRASQLDIQVLRSFSRQNSALTTVTLATPTFTPPVISPHRDFVTFTVCFSGAGLSAGQYQGAVIVEGPNGVSPTNLAFNVNVQDETMFLVTLGVAGVLVLVLLFWRGATTVQTDAAKAVANDVRNADPTPDGVVEVPAEAAMPARTAVQSKARWALRTDVLTDPLFWASTVLSTAAAIAAAWAVFTANTGWGANPVTDVFGVVSTIVAAAGFQSLIASAAGK